VAMTGVRIKGREEDASVISTTQMAVISMSTLVIRASTTNPAVYQHAPCYLSEIVLTLNHDFDLPHNKRK